MDGWDEYVGIFVVDLAGAIWMSYKYGFWDHYGRTSFLCVSPENVYGTF